MNNKGATKLKGFTFSQELAILTSGKYIVKRTKIVEKKDQNGKTLIDKESGEPILKENRDHIYKKQDLNNAVVLSVLLDLNEALDINDKIIEEENLIRQENKDSLSKGDFSLPTDIYKKLRLGWIPVSGEFIEEQSGYFLNYRACREAIKSLAVKKLIFLNDEKKNGNNTQWKIRINFKKIYNDFVRITNDHIRLPGYEFNREALIWDFEDDKEEMQTPKYQQVIIDEKDQKIALLEEAVLNQNKEMTELKNLIKSLITGQQNLPADLRDKNCSGNSSRDIFCPEIKTQDKKCPGENIEHKDDFSKKPRTKNVSNDLIIDSNISKSYNSNKSINLNQINQIHWSGNLIDLNFSKKGIELINLNGGYLNAFLSKIQSIDSKGYITRTINKNTEKVFITEKITITDDYLKECFKIMKTKSLKSFGLFFSIFVVNFNEIQEALKEKDLDYKKKKEKEQLEEEKKRLEKERLKNHPHIIWKNKNKIDNNYFDKQLLNLTEEHFNFFKLLFNKASKHHSTNEGCYQKAWKDYEWWLGLENPYYLQLKEKFPFDFYKIWSDFIALKISEEDLIEKYKLNLINSFNYLTA